MPAVINRTTKEPTVWLVEDKKDGPIGEVVATNRAGALATAKAKWPMYDVHVESKAGHEALCKTLQARLDRNPGPIAYHEAGHAVVGLSLGLHLNRASIGVIVSVSSDLDSFGRTEWRPVRNESCRMFDEKFRSIAERRIMMAMAGPIAEGRHRGLKRTLKPAGTDRGLIHTMATIHSDSAILTALTGNRIIDKQYIAWLESRSKVAVALTWPRIEHVAKALIKDRELSGAKVKRLMAEIEPGPFNPDLLRTAFP